MADSLQSKIERAKEKLSGAAQACLENRPGAPEAANQARAEVDSLLAIERSTAHECEYPGCSTLTLQRYCAKHRPQGEWAISEQVRADIEHDREGER